MTLLGRSVTSQMPRSVRRSRDLSMPALVSTASVVLKSMVRVKRRSRQRRLRRSTDSNARNSKSIERSSPITAHD